MIKRRLLMVAAALAVGTSVAGAQARLGPPARGAHVLPAHEIITILRSTGFDPVGRPVKMGSRYEIQAVDPDDFEVTLLVDGRTGRILTVRDSDEAWLEPSFPPEGVTQTAGRFGPLSYGPLHPGGLVPPRSIPAQRSSATLDPRKAPTPRPRPEATHAPAVASNAARIPANQGAMTNPVAAAAPGAAGAPSTAAAPGTTAAPGTAGASGSSAAPPAANAGIKGTASTIGGHSTTTISPAGKTEKTASNAANTPAPGGPPAPDAAAITRANGAVRSVPVAPLE